MGEVSGRLRSRWCRSMIAVLAAGCVVLPLATVVYPPISDLPQHLLQIRLAQETLTGVDGTYRIQWLAPYGMAYLPLALGWLVAEPVAAGRMGVACLLALWVLALHRLASVRQRPVASALLASALATGFSLYWGFLPFLGGFPWFLWWLHRTARSESEPERTVNAREIAVLAALATALYLTHAHWFAMAGLWLAFSGLRARMPVRLQLLRGLALIPGALLGVSWLGVVRVMGLDSTLRWVSNPLQRWAPGELVASIVGGPRGLGRELLLAFLLAWLGLGLFAWFRRRSEPRAEAAIDRRLLWAGLLMIAVASFSPEYYLSLWSAKRWWAPGVALIVLGGPVPWGQGGSHRASLAWGVVAASVLALWTTLAVVTWRRFERNELAGLSESLAALPQRSRILGLDYVGRSRIFEGRPFMHDFAYGQALKGGSSNFSFASFPASPVIVRQVQPQPWTMGLEWFPGRVRQSDFQYFDYVLVNASLARLEEFPRRAPLEPVTQTAPWRLYRVVAER